ncbi:MAG TPA: carboxypeptidase-like regulatory domain-containing protein [Bacteroidales bacterium]|nr:carboxypeptidase-like regulatory domain-containing protein [Bacteroidales bacterium]
MKNLILFFVVFQISAALYSQVISGVVLDSQTNDTIPFASVYFNGTFVGTSTDNHGRFSIDISGRSAMPLTVSAVGYYSVTISGLPAKEIKVLLEPKVYEMKEVHVSGASLLEEREADLKIFRREFLGGSIYGKRCEILNEKDVTFNYGSSDTLKAYAKNLIRIHNPLLGYNMACFLDEFVYCRQTGDFRMTGYILYQQDLKDSSDLKKIIKRRRHAYYGSPMHFFRSLYSNTVQKQGFTGYSSEHNSKVYLSYSNEYVYNSSEYIKGKSLYKKTVTEGEGIKYFYFNGNLTISYNRNLTYFKFLSDNIAFNHTGQYDFTKISLSGKMAELRVGDWLPFEYVPN